MVLDSHIPLGESIISLLETDYSDKKRFHRAINILKRPQNILKKKLIIKLSNNGKKKVFQSFRVQHSDAKGPFMGGTRYVKGLTEQNCSELSIQESLKLALLDLPFGGAFGGIDLEKSSLTVRDLGRLTKSYSQFLTSHIGAWKDILSTNAGTSQETQNWMLDAYEKKKKFHSPATFTDNRLNLDGSIHILDEYLKTSNLVSRFRKLDIAICGFGNRAYIFASNLNTQNFRVVALTDKSGGVVDSNGLVVETVKKLQIKFSTLKEVSVMENFEFISNEDLLKLPVDILVVASSEPTTLNDCKAKLILELSKVIESLQKNLEVLPNVLLNSGLSFLSYIDWVQKMHGYRWSREEVTKKLQTTMIKTFIEVKSIVDAKNISYQDASYYLGAKRIVDAIMERGRV